MKKACIFDLDGTLLYTLESMASPGNRVLQELGLRPLPVGNYRYYCGQGADRLVKKILIDAGDRDLSLYEEARARYRTYFNENPLFGVRPYPGIEQTLAEMKKRVLVLKDGRLEWNI